MIVPSFNFRWENIVTSVNIKMVHSTPLSVFMYGHWDDHTLDKIFLSLYKREYTTPYWLEGKITWLEQSCDLTWLENNSNDLTWLTTQVLLTWLDLWLEQGWLVTTLMCTCVCASVCVYLYHHSTSKALPTWDFSSHTHRVKVIKKKTHKSNFWLILNYPI